jgi:hypothetical protein
VIGSPETSTIPHAAGGRNMAIDPSPRICSSTSASDAPGTPSRFCGAPSMAWLIEGSPNDQLARLIHPTAAISSKTPPAIFIGRRGSSSSRLSGRIRPDSLMR